LEKCQERWWESLLVNEEKLDLKCINPEKPMEELDAESQAKINQMMYDEHQKKLGLPTSEEQVSSNESLSPMNFSFLFFFEIFVRKNSRC
jgi:hypothetical protein